jgi:hypothetical protein
MHARLRHASELEALFADIGKRPMGGPATELMPPVFTETLTSDYLSLKVDAADMPGSDIEAFEPAG